MKDIEDRERLLLLKPYTQYEEVVNEFGEPDDVVGSGFVIIQYRLPNERKIELNFGRGDKLYVLAEISTEGIFIEIFNCFKNP
jgi:hypothetical protein